MAIDLVEILFCDKTWFWLQSFQSKKRRKNKTLYIADSVETELSLS